MVLVLLVVVRVLFLLGARVILFYVFGGSAELFLIRGWQCLMVCGGNHRLFFLLFLLSMYESIPSLFPLFCFEFIVFRV